ncbi:unnamed protein product [Absidia cylindrospora]
MSEQQQQQGAFVLPSPDRFEFEDQEAAMIYIRDFSQRHGYALAIGRSRTGRRNLPRSVEFKCDRGGNYTASNTGARIEMAPGQPSPFRKFCWSPRTTYHCARAPPPSPTYLADGTVYVNDSGLELVLFEASGKLGTRDRRRHTKDHMAAMRFFTLFYPNDSLRLWVMKPCYDGEVITFERMDRVTITTNYNDKREAIQLMTFFWKVKGCSNCHSMPSVTSKLPVIRTSCCYKARTN